MRRKRARLRTTDRELVDRLWEQLRQIRIFSASAGDTITDAEAISLIRHVVSVDVGPGRMAPRPPAAELDGGAAGGRGRR